MGFCKDSAREIKKAGVSTIKLHTGKPIPGRSQGKKGALLIAPALAV